MDSNVMNLSGFWDTMTFWAIAEPESSSINLGILLTWLKLTIARKFTRYANLSWINNKFCSTAGLISYLDLVITSSQCGLGRHTERFNDFCRECRFTEEEEVVIRFLCQCPSLERCKYSLFGSQTLVSLTELLSIDVMGRHTERFNDFCRECRSAEEEEVVIRFLCQCPSLAWCKYRLFGSQVLVIFTELSFIDFKDLVTFIKFSG